MCNLTKIVNKKISHTIGILFIIWGVVLNILMAGKVVLFVIQYSALWKLLFLVEVITAPITVIFVILYIVQLLKWRWFDKFVFTKAYIVSTILSALIIVVEVIAAETAIDIESSILSIIGFIIMPFFPLLDLSGEILLAYGWYGFETMIPALVLSAIIFMPLIISLIAVIIKYLLQKNKKRLEAKQTKIAIIISIFIVVILGILIWIWQSYLIQNLYNSMKARLADTNVVSETKNQANENVFQIDDVKMILPEGWSADNQTQSRVYIKIDYNEPYDVFLKIEASKNQISEIKRYKEDRSGYEYTTTQNGEIFKIACGGAFDCNGAIMDGDVYTFVWYIESNQPAPENLDGVWTPDNNVTREDIWNILKSIKKLNDAEVINLEQKVISKDDAIIVFDSTKRKLNERKLVYPPLTLEEINKNKYKYTVNLVDVPECSGTIIQNSYIVPFEGSALYDHVIIYIQHSPLESELQTGLEELRNDECFYIKRTLENQDKTDALLENYRVAYEKQDLEKIQELLKELKH